MIVHFPSRMNMGRIFAVLILLVAALALPAAEPPTVRVVELRGLTTEDKVAVYALAGLLNRDGPRVFIRGGKEIRWSSLLLEPEKKEHGENWDAATKGDLTRRFGDTACTEDLWMEHFGSSGRFKFEKTTLPELLKSSKVVKGCILYQSLNEDCCPAATLAGLEDAIPLTAKARERLEAQGVSLTVVFDYTAIRATFAAGSDPRIEGHRWAIKELLPRCAKTGVVSRDRTYGLDAHDTVVDIDQAVQKRWFVYDLDHRSKANRDKPVDRDPPDKVLIDQILSSLQPFSPVFGWGRPDENGFTRSVGRNRQVVVCSGVLNNSFFAVLPSQRKVWKQRKPHVTVDTVKPEERIYVALMVNEGDSVKEAISLQGMGGWTQPERSTLPINWGMDPLLCTTHPGLMDYYYDTMSDQDYFFAAPAGWGYVHPAFMESDMLTDYTSLVRKGGQLADLRYVDVWWLGKVDPHAFLRAADMRGMTLWDGGEQSVRYADDGLPVIHGNNYYTFVKGPEQFAEMLTADMKNVKPPWFVIVYGASDHATPYRFAEMVKRLPQDRFKAVHLDEFFSAAEKCRAQVEKRVWKPGPNAPKGVAP